MVRLDKKATRLYVLDTNVLIHDPTALYHFDEHDVVIPMTVLEELVTRAGRNTKIVCLGNVGQIDTPYLTANTCGMAAVVERFRDWPHAGHITLKSVERSRLALAAEELL